MKSMLSMATMISMMPMLFMWSMMTSMMILMVISVMAATLKMSSLVEWELVDQSASLSWFLIVSLRDAIWPIFWNWIFKRMSINKFQTIIAWNYFSNLYSNVLKWILTYLVQNIADTVSVKWCWSAKEKVENVLPEYKQIISIWIFVNSLLYLT